MNKKTIITIGFLILLPFICQAQKDRNINLIKAALKGLEYEVKAGISIGGVTPIPLPAEIRAIDNYNPTALFSIEGNITKWFNNDWGLLIGLRLENKGMKTRARVKNYNMEMSDADQGHMKGSWTGYVHTKIRNSYLTLPILATYKISPRWIVKGGIYASYLTEGNFSGDAYDGYLRDETPTGDKIWVISATYDFSDDLRPFACGAQLSGEWKAFKHLNIYADLTWGFIDIFKRDFDVIQFNMYPIFLNMGFAYAF